MRTIIGQPVVEQHERIGRERLSQESQPSSRNFFTRTKFVSHFYSYGQRGGKIYDGKGDKNRAKQSAKRIETEHKDPVKKQEFKPAKNSREAFKAEDANIQKHGGAGNTEKNYNKINSLAKNTMNKTRNKYD